MNHKNLFDSLPLQDLFNSVELYTYTIVRGSEYNITDYRKGSDIDIFSYDIHAFCQKALAFFNQLDLDKDWYVEITEVSETQIHLDYMYREQLEIRLDLYAALPQYSKVAIRPSLFESVIENSKSIAVPGHPDVKISVPSNVDDLLLRYIEYIQYYELRPDKLKHLEYIEEKLPADKDEKSRFFTKLHHYTDLPKCTANPLNVHPPPEKLPAQELLKILLRKLVGRQA